MKQLEDAGIISHSMSNWASPILVIMPKKPDPNESSTKNNKQFNLRLCIDYCKLNNRILAARQIKADGRIGKVVANYLLPTTDNLLAHFKDCKYISTLDQQSRYYHIKLTLEAAKTAFVIDKGKWKFHSLLFGINLDPSTFSYVLGKVLASCHNFTLNYLVDIIIFSRKWEECLKHLEELFKQLKHADMKIKCSKCKFFKSKAHYLGYLVGMDGVQSLPEKLEAINKLLTPTNVGVLCQFLGITGFYRKFVPFYADITNCFLLNYSGKKQNSNGLSNAIMLSTFSKKNYAKGHLYNTQILTKLSNCLQMCPTIAILASYIKHKMKGQIN